MQSQRERSSYDKDQKCTILKLNKELDIMPQNNRKPTLLLSISLYRRSLSFGKRPQASIENNGAVVAERFDITWVNKKYTVNAQLLMKLCFDKQYEERGADLEKQINI